MNFYIFKLGEHEGIICFTRGEENFTTHEESYFSRRERDIRCRVKIMLIKSNSIRKQTKRQKNRIRGKTNRCQRSLIQKGSHLNQAWKTTGYRGSDTHDHV